MSRCASDPLTVHRRWRVAQRISAACPLTHANPFSHAVALRPLPRRAPISSACIDSEMCGRILRPTTSKQFFSRLRPFLESASRKCRQQIFQLGLVCTRRLLYRHEATFEATRNVRTTTRIYVKAGRYRIALVILRVYGPDRPGVRDADRVSHHWFLEGLQQWRPEGPGQKGLAPCGGCLSARA